MQVPLAINTTGNVMAKAMAQVMVLLLTILPAGRTQVVLEAGSTVIAVHTVRLEARLRSLVGRNGQEDMNLNGLSQLIGCLCISISRQRTIGA